MGALLKINEYVARICERECLSIECYRVVSMVEQAVELGAVSETDLLGSVARYLEDMVEEAKRRGCGEDDVRVLVEAVEGLRSLARGPPKGEG